MRVIFAVVLLIASSGMIYASFTADAPVPGIDYDVTEVVQESCQKHATVGDKLLSFVSSGGPHSSGSLDTAGKSTGRLFKYISCQLLDN
jgi:hypothetical protein